MISTAAAPPWGDPIGSRYPQMAAPAPPPLQPRAQARSSSGQHIISIRRSSLVGAESESLILELLLMTGLLFVRHALVSHSHIPGPRPIPLSSVQSSGAVTRVSAKTENFWAV